MATYESNEVQISVYKWDKHKKPSLVIGERGKGFSVATFNSEKSAEEFVNAFNVFLFGCEGQEHESNKK